MAVNPESCPVAVHEILEVAGEGRGEQVTGIPRMDRL